MIRTLAAVCGRTAVLLLIAAVALIAPFAAARPAAAATTFIVNHVGDAADLTLADSFCDASSAFGAQCTLRAAIQEANDTPGRDTIAFAIPGAGVKTIKPATALPFVTDAVVIDGYTQGDARPNTLATGTNAVLRIELDGSDIGAGNGFGLLIQAPNSLVKGLTINRFDNLGVEIRQAAGPASVIAGCFIGTNPAGTAALSNRDGVRVFGGTGTIGGTTPAARNLISGNISDAVVLLDPDTVAKVQGNLIGTAKDGVARLGNSGDGIAILDVNGAVVGGNGAAANTIAFNGEDGVAVERDSDGNRILRNAIFANADLGIDLANDGPTPNDPGDADAGPNALQNAPVLDSAVTAGGATTIRGRLNSAANATFVLRFFANPPNGNEGMAFRGFVSVTTNSQGNATFAFTPAQPIPAGNTVTATATSATGDTSEFSAPKTVTG